MEFGWRNGSWPWERTKEDCQYYEQPTSAQCECYCIHSPARHPCIWSSNLNSYGKSLNACRDELVCAEDLWTTCLHLSRDTASGTGHCLVSVQRQPRPSNPLTSSCDNMARFLLLISAAVQQYLAAPLTSIQSKRLFISASDTNKYICWLNILNA